MTYTSLRQCVDDLQRSGRLVRIPVPLDPDLEMAAVHRRVSAAGGPALLFERVKGSRFPAVSNLFGTLERARFIFRATLAQVQHLVALKADPALALRALGLTAGAARAAVCALPRQVARGAVLSGRTRIGDLPQIRCWPGDGGAFILLPQVYSEHPAQPGALRANIGMYRVQLSGNDYRPGREIGLHYQIRRDIAAHHAAAMQTGRPLKVSIFVGGPPAHTFAAVMPLPEQLPEAAFAGALAGRRWRWLRRGGFVLSADADFCITGTVDPHRTLPEGPFGDHLGYYSLRHRFPFLRVQTVYHRRDAVWPFTVVGRPPQEDTIFGALVHEITGPMVPVSIPGVDALHAVDAAGVHPLLLAVGRESYAPTEPRRPRELLATAHAVLGFGHCSLAKYLLICAREDNPALDVRDVTAFFTHVLQRVDWRRDLHFQTRTTMDTLDYSCSGLNNGSKLVVAAAGKTRRRLAVRIPDGLDLPAGIRHPALALPGVMVVQGPAVGDAEGAAVDVQRLAAALETAEGMQTLPLVVMADDSAFAARRMDNFLWVTFTRSDPARDIHGAGAFTEHKHWGCTGPLIIDARVKPHHAPPLDEDPAVTRRVDELGKKGGVLHGVI